MWGWGRDKSPVEDIGAWSLSCWGKEVNTHALGMKQLASLAFIYTLRRMEEQDFYKRARAGRNKECICRQVELQHGPGGVGEQAEAERTDHGRDLLLTLDEGAQTNLWCETGLIWINFVGDNARVCGVRTWTCKNPFTSLLLKTGNQRIWRGVQDSVGPNGRGRWDIPVEGISHTTQGAGAVHALEQAGVTWLCSVLW